MAIDYASKPVWGKIMWDSMRCVAHNYPENPSISEISHARAFYLSLQHLMPCHTCRTNYAADLLKHPIGDATKNRSSLIAWVETIYSETNTRITQPRETLPPPPPASFSDGRAMPPPAPPPKPGCVKCDEKARMRAELRH